MHVMPASFASFATVALSSLAALGCGPAALPLDAGTDAAGADASSDAGVSGDVVMFHIVRGLSPSRGAAASNCAVSIVAPGPRRFEGAADADGNVTLAGFSWGADGRLSASFATPEHAAYSLSGFTRGDYEAGLVDGRYEIFLLARGSATAGTVRVSGTAAGLNDPMDLLYVQPTLSDGSTSAGRGVGYELRVPPGATFRLLSTDLVTARGIDRSVVQTIYRWALSGELGPLTSDRVEDIDLGATEIASTTTTLTFVMPDAPFFRDVTSEINVVQTALAGELLTGLTALLTVGGDERTVDASIASVTVSGATDSRTVVAVSGALGASSSTLDVAPSGTIDPLLLTPPTIDETGTRPLFSPVPVLGTLAGLETRVRVDDTSGNLLWTVVAPLGASLITMPALPFESMTDTLGASGSPVFVSAQICELATPRTERCRRLATSPRAFSAVP